MEKKRYKLAFTRDFTLAMLEVWYKCEAHNLKQWNGKKQKHLPYLIFWRTDGTVKSFYDSHGIDWIKNELKEHILNDAAFLLELEHKVKEKLKLIQPIYQKEKVLPKRELLQFIGDFEDAYTWVEALWWLCHLYEDGELTKFNFDSIIQLRKETDALSSGTDMVVRKSLRSIFPEIKDFIQVLALEEIKTGKILPIEELKKRDVGFFYTENTLFVNESKENIEKKYGVVLEEESAKKESNEVTGSMAYPGKVIGRVRKVMGHKDISLIKAGEILVSPMTMPDFVPAMEKAAAFVTDEGGILCHAAIVAREMKKPCIVGTQFATKVFKNGDLVEVNAEKGVVRKLYSLA